MLTPNDSDHEKRGSVKALILDVEIRLNPEDSLGYLELDLKTAGAILRKQAVSYLKRKSQECRRHGGHRETNECAVLEEFKKYSLTHGCQKQCCHTSDQNNMTRP